MTKCRPTKGFCQVKKKQKIRLKLRSGWVGRTSTGIVNFFWKLCFFVIFVLFFVVVHISKKNKKWIGGWVYVIWQI